MAAECFADHFSGHALAYAHFRPRYPRALFEYLARIVPGRKRVWDCATGSGQAALGLSEFFENVIATDASSQQLKTASAHPRVSYRVAPAEASGLGDQSVELVTVAQALHWFDLPKFFAEAARVLTSKGVLAVWTYDLLCVTPEIDRLVHEFYHVTNARYWPPQRVLVDEQYRNIALPFPELTPPPFEMSARWNFEQLLGYLKTWSAVPKLIAARGPEPVRTFAHRLRVAWGDPMVDREVRWPLTVRIGVSA